MVRRNLFANYIGISIVTLIQLAVAPVFASYLGPEAYGLIGIQITLTTLASVVDLGLTPTLSRELARLSAVPAGECSMRSLVRLLQGFYLVMAVLLAGVLIFSVPYLATTWINPDQLSTETVGTALGMIALQIGFQLPLGFYAGGLIGLQRHVALNTINVIGAVLRNGGAVLFLMLLSPTIPQFFGWHVATTAIHLAVLARTVWRLLPQGTTRIAGTEFKAIKKYALGMTGIVALSLLLTQIDKIILSRTLSLADFGYYMLAGTLTMTLGKPVGPLFTTLMPRMTQLVEGGKTEGLVLLYQQGTQFASLLIVPILGVLVFFSYECVMLWTLDESAARTLSPLMAPLAIGFACNALMYIPYALTLACGWIRFALVQNAIACLLMIPLTIWLSYRYGALGGAWSWAVLNLGYVLVSLFFLHQRLLPSEYKRWYLFNLLPALAATALPVIAVSALLHSLDLLGIVVKLASALSLSIILTALALPHMRQRLLSRGRLHA